MDIPDLQIESVHLGSWLSIQSLKSLIPEMSAHYQRRLRKYHIGDASDLAQAAHLSVLMWESENVGVERIRELVGIGLLHRSMTGEVRGNRKQSIGGGEFDVGERSQLSEKQIETLNLWTMIASKAARKPLYEMVYLRRGLGWSALAVSEYMRKKKDERRYWSPEEVDRLVAKGVRRIKRKMPPDLNLDLRLLAFLP